VRRKLFRAQCDDGDNIEEHIRMLRGYREELNMLSPTSKITDEDFAITLLTSLPESWNPFIAAIDQTSLSDADKLVARILAEDRRIKSRDNTSLAGQDKHFKRKKKYDPTVTCYNCGRKGHIKPDCRSPPREGGQNKSGHKGADKAHVADSGYSFATTDKEFGLPAIASDAWLADSATTSHVVKDKKYFQNLMETPGHKIHGFGSASAKGRGSVQVKCTVGKKCFNITLKDALYAPDAPFNLISIGRLEEAGSEAIFKNHKAYFVSASGVTFAEGNAIGRLYQMMVTPIEQHTAYVASTKAHSWTAWHRILGHMNMASIKALKEKDMVTGMEVDLTSDPSLQCAACIQAKQHVESFPKESTRNIQEIGDLTHTDLWGPARTISIGGYKYFITFTDGKSRRTMVYFLKEKTQEAVLDTLKAYKAYVKAQTGKDLKKIRADNGKEYANQAMQKYCQSIGIAFEFTAPYSPQQNGVAERLNRTIAELVRAVLIQGQLPKSLWAEAVTYICYIKNCAPSRALKDDKTPDEVFWGRKPDISKLQEFGAKCWVLQQDGQRQKLDPKSRHVIFTGFSDESRAYRYFDPQTRKIRTSRNVIFEETPQEKMDEEVVVVQPPTVEEDRGSTNSDLHTSNDVTPSRETSELPEEAPPVPLRQPSSRIAQREQPNYAKLNNPAARRIPVRKTNVVPQEQEQDHALITMSGQTMDDPQSLEEAKARPDWPKWKEAMEEEMDCLSKAGTWRKVPLPSNRKAIACRWVFHLKTNNDGTVVKYKARLVAKGFTQVPGIDFFNTYAPALSLDTLRTIIAMATAQKLELHHLDVKSAYLNGVLEEEIFMMQPPDYQDGTSLVCKLHKAIYGLKQAGKVWNDLLNQTFSDLGYTRSRADPCLYYRHTDAGLTLVGVHVDDMTIAAKSCEVGRIKEELASKFEVSDLGKLTKILGFEVKQSQDKKTVGLFQTQYIHQLLEKYRMENCNPVATPLDHNVKFTKLPDGMKDPKMDGKPYQALIGSLLYAARGTRPDISFAVQHLSQFSSNPSIAHWTAAKRILRYLKKTINYAITYGDNSNITISAFSDADWGANLIDRRSISGYMFSLAGGPIAWSSKKQTTVALSSMEAEYMALAHASQQAIWIHTLLSEMGHNITEPITIWVDNQAAIAHAITEMTMQRTKHIDIKYHFIRDAIAQELIIPDYIDTKDNLADFLTKALPAPRHMDLCKRIGLSPELRGSVGIT
jgi:hypothetical protein